MPKNKFYFTGSGMLRIRWWPLAAACALGIVYFGINVATLAMVVAGATGRADRFWHAPIAFLFGS